MSPYASFGISLARLRKILRRMTSRTSLSHTTSPHPTRPCWTGIWCAALSRRSVARLLIRPSWPARWRFPRSSACRASVSKSKSVMISSSMVIMDCSFSIRRRSPCSNMSASHAKRNKSSSGCASSARRLPQRAMAATSCFRRISICLMKCPMWRQMAQREWAFFERNFFT